MISKRPVGWKEPTTAKTSKKTWLALLTFWFIVAWSLEALAVAPKGSAGYLFWAPIIIWVTFRRGTWMPLRALTVVMLIGLVGMTLDGRTFEQQNGDRAADKARSAAQAAATAAKPPAPQSADCESFLAILEAAEAGDARWKEEERTGMPHSTDANGVPQTWAERKAIKAAIYNMPHEGCKL